MGACAPAAAKFGEKGPGTQEAPPHLVWRVRPAAELGAGEALESQGRRVGTGGRGGGDAAGPLAPEKTRGPETARERARGVAGEQWPGVTHRGYF